MLRQSPLLPNTFPGRSSAGDGGGFDRVGGGVTGVTSHVGGPGRMTSCASDRTGRRVIGIAGGARRAAPYLTTRPGPRGFDGFARPVVIRVFLLEVREHAFGAVGGPKRQ